MNKRELEYLKKLLERVKDPDGHIAKGLAFVNKDLASYEARRGQMKDQYESETFYHL